MKKGREKEKRFFPMQRHIMRESSSSKRAWERGKLYEKPAQDYR